MRSIVALVAAFAAAAAAPPSSTLTPIFTFQLKLVGTYGTTLTVDAAGNSYVVGTRYAAAPFPVTDNAFEKTSRSLFVTKIDARGERFVWATYLGGTRNPISTA